MNRDNQTPTHRHSKVNDTSTNNISSSNQSSFLTPFGLNNQSNDSETYLTPNAIANNITSLIAFKSEDLLKSFLYSKITLLKIRSIQVHKKENNSQNILSLLQNKPSWHLHLLLHAYGIPFNCYNVNTTKALGYTLPILINGDEILVLNKEQSAKSTAIANNKFNVFQIIEHEIKVIDYIDKLSSLTDTFIGNSNLDSPIDITHSYWLNYVHTSLNLPLLELKSLVEHDKIESSRVNKMNIKRFFNFNVTGNSDNDVDEGVNPLTSIFSPSSQINDSYNNVDKELRIQELTNHLLYQYEFLSEYLSETRNNRKGHSQGVLFAAMGPKSSHPPGSPAMMVDQASVETALFSHIIEALSVNKIADNIFEKQFVRSQYQHVIEFAMIIVHEFFQVSSTDDASGQEKEMNGYRVLETSSILELMANSYQQLRFKESGAYPHIFSRLLSLLPKEFASPYDKLRKYILPLFTSASTFDSMVLTWKLRLPWFEDVLRKLNDVKNQESSTTSDSNCIVTQSNEKNEILLPLSGSIYIGCVFASFIGFVALSSVRKI